MQTENPGILAHPGTDTVRGTTGQMTDAGEPVHLAAPLRRRLVAVWRHPVPATCAVHPASASLYAFPMTAPNSPRNRPPTLLLRRLAALFYDFWPALALWMLVSALFTVAYTVAGHPPRENIAPLSALQWLLWLACWASTGVYATLSWRYGGQTLGMRPWRLHLRADNAPPSMAQLWKRYVLATLSLACAGLGFWWVLFDPERRTLHDRLSGTRLVFVPKQ